MTRLSLSRQMAPRWLQSQNILNANDHQVRALKLNEVSTVNSNRLSRITRKVQIACLLRSFILVNVFASQDNKWHPGKRVFLEGCLMQDAECGTPGLHHLGPFVEVQSFDEVSF